VKTKKKTGEPDWKKVFSDVEPTPSETPVADLRVKTLTAFENNRYFVANFENSTVKPHRLQL